MNNTEPESLTVVDDDGVNVYVYRWRPDGAAKGVVHVAHGMGEHARRYDRVAQGLNSAGYTVYADDHRASGRTGAEGSGLGDLGPGGMAGALESLHVVTAHAAGQENGLPLFLLGHSWGSFLAQRVADRWGSELAGLILSGSTLLTMDYLSLEDPNTQFEPAATPYDWLSRDPAEVQRYIEDPWCGFEVAFDVGELLHLGGPPAPGIRPDLPILILNGSADAVGGFSGGGAALARTYGELGVADVTYLGYEDARHELFNEINRVQVLADVVAWLDHHTP
ncbi:MAG: alpha/beta hydrolase [Acidimicrobiales bacterium]